MKADPYLFFRGNCAEALDFYRAVLGAEVRALVRFRDMPGAAADAGDKIMHAELDVGGSTVFASDGQAADAAATAGFAIALQTTDEAEAERLFAALADGGQVSVPLMTTPFASRFGMTADRFGTPWMVTNPQPAR